MSRAPVHRRVTPRHGGAVAVFALAAGAWTPIAAVIAFMATGALHVRGSSVGAWLALVLLGAPVLHLLARNAVREGAAAALGVALLGLVPTFFFAAAWSWSEPIVYEGWRCGTGDIGLVTIGLPMAGGASVVMATVGVFLARLGRGRRILAALALCAVVGSGALLASTYAKLSRPAPEDWTASLPVVARIDYPAPPADGSPYVGTLAHRIAPRVALERECTLQGEGEYVSSYCRIRLRHVGEGPVGAPVTPVSCGEEVDCLAGHSIGVSADEGAVVRRDAAHGLWVVEGTGSTGLDHAFDSSLSPTAVEPIEVADTIAPPPLWWWLAALGLAAALAVLGGRVRLMRRRRTLSNARPGRVEGDDVVFDDGELPRRGALRAPAPTGPALALPTAASGMAGYRDDGARGAWIAVPGNRSDVMGRIRLRILGCDALALALIVVTLTPLLVALR